VLVDRLDQIVVAELWAVTSIVTVCNRPVDGFTSTKVSVNSRTVGAAAERH
jgi:hypothetical protein